MARCQICCKSAVTGSQVSHSQIHNKRKFRPNLQKVNGLVLCTRCLKSIKKEKRIEENLRQSQIDEAQKKRQEAEVEKVEKVSSKSEKK